MIYLINLGLLFFFFFLVLSFFLINKIITRWFLPLPMVAPIGSLLIKTRTRFIVRGVHCCSCSSCNVIQFLHLGYQDRQEYVCKMHFRKGHPCSRKPMFEAGPGFFFFFGNKDVSTSINLEKVTTCKPSRKPADEEIFLYFEYLIINQNNYQKDQVFGTPQLPKSWLRLYRHWLFVNSSQLKVGSWTSASS